jgi:hypothetical protein
VCCQLFQKSILSIDIAGWNFSSLCHSLEGSNITTLSTKWMYLEPNCNLFYVESWTHEVESCEAWQPITANKLKQLKFILNDDRLEINHIFLIKRIYSEHLCKALHIEHWQFGKYHLSPTSILLHCRIEEFYESFALECCNFDLNDLLQIIQYLPNLRRLRVRARCLHIKKDEIGKHLSKMDYLTDVAIGDSGLAKI